jgi:hypothetical protein
MTPDIEQFEQLIEPLRAQVAPLGVKLHFLYEDDTYYVLADGSATYPPAASNPDPWRTHWGHPFSRVICGMMRPYFSFAQEMPEASGALHARIRLGNLFDMLQR